MNISIRLENQEDHRVVENLTRETFWDLFKPGCDEHLMVHKIRKTDAFIKELDFVACDDDTIVGNIIYTKAKVINENSKVFDVLCMGPLSVLPSYQGKGIGTLLMEHSIKAAKVLGYNAVIIYGHPNYYHRFGFENAKKFDIQTLTGDNFDAFMVLELYEHALDSISGRFHIDAVYEIDKDELEDFDKQFPYKGKKRTDDSE